MIAADRKLIAVLALSAFPALGAVDARLRTVQYSADEVYQLRGHAGYMIDVQFEVGEKFLGLGAGDLAGLAFFGQDNHLFIKPKVARVVTNLTVLTSRRHYQFEYTTTVRGAGAILALRFNYPIAVEVTPAVVENSVARRLANAATSRMRNEDYWYCGAATLMPAAAWDDGVRTRLRFETRAEQPAVFVLNDDNSESLLNFSVEGDDLVVQRVARRFVLRRGALTGCIVNKGFLGSGERLTSGTVSTGVERMSAGSTP